MGPFTIYKVSSSCELLHLYNYSEGLSEKGPSERDLSKKVLQLAYHKSLTSANSAAQHVYVTHTKGLHNTVTFSLYKGGIERRSSLGRQFPLILICRLTVNCNCNKLFLNRINSWPVKYDTKITFKKNNNSIKAAILYTFYILTILEC